MSESKIPTRSVLSVAIRPKADPDRANLKRAVAEFAQQDPTLSVDTESTEGETIIGGMGELQLEIACNRIVHEYGVEIEVEGPKVIYLETIRRRAEAEGKFIRRNLYAHVKLRIEPLPSGSGYQFVNEIANEAVPTQFIEPINSGIQATMKVGILAGHEMVDLRAVLYDGSYHEEDSNDIVFKVAASMAFKDAARKASPVILEPVMSAEVMLAEEFMSVVIGDLNSRRGRIEAVEHRADRQVIHAVVPLAEMIGYANHIRMITGGRSDVSIDFLRYDQAPRGNGYGADEAGVTANKPTHPKAGSGSAAADLHTA